MIITNSLNDVFDYVKDKKRKEVLARVGVRTNGDLHIGNIVPIMTSFIIGDKLVKENYKFKMIVVLVDIEDNNEQFPFIYQKDNLNCHKNLAEHSICLIKSFIKDLKKLNPKIEISLDRVSDMLNTKRFRDTIEDYISLGKNEFKINPVCENCKSINRDWSIFNNKIYFNCQFCKQEQNYNIKVIKFAIDHDLLGVIENLFYHIDIHIIGRDHIVIDNLLGSSSFDKREFYSSYLQNNKEYITLLTPLILGNNGKKMSKSANNGLFLSEIKVKMRKNYIERLYTLTKELVTKNMISIDFNKVYYLLFQHLNTV